MKINIKKLLPSAAFLLCCAFSAMAQLGTPPNNEIWYMTEEGEILDDGDYDVGETLCSLTITAHEYDSYYRHFYIRFNGNVTEINDEAFYDEDDLTAVSFPNTVVWIGRETDGTGVFEDCDNLESVTVPASVKYIGRCAFYDCIALKSFSCDNVEIIYPEAFYNCENLKSVNLGTKLKEIKWSTQGNEYGAFEVCDKLETIVIPASVTHIGKRAFYYCDALKFVAIGSGTQEIAEKAFYNCNELKSIAIESNGVSIGEDAFNDCEKLESVAFLGNTPPSSFGEDCFYDCSPNLRYYVFEENYNTYNGNSFLRGKVVAGPPYNEIWYTTNDGRTAGYKHPSVTTLTLNAYMGSHGVQFFNGNPPEFSYGGSCFYECSNLVSTVLPSSINYIGSLAFGYCYSLVSVSIPSTVTGIGNSAFEYCTSLESISIPSTVTGIGDHAFSSCTNLQNIILPDRLNYIGASVFRYCSGLQSITIPIGVNTIPLSAFEQCNSLRSATILGAINIGQFAFYKCSSLQSVTLPNSVTSIGEHAFDNCIGLQSVTIPNSMTDIGEMAFGNCWSLHLVTFKSIPSLGQNPFDNWGNQTSKILDLTDSDKPFIGNSLANYPAGGFTAVHYHGTLEPGEWGTIVLPFVPSSYSGIVFFSIDNVDAANSTLTLSVAENIVAGRPYLIRNQTGDAGFTLSASATSVPVNINASEQAVGTFALKGNYSNNNVLTEDGLYQLDGGEFVRVSSLGIDPFRAYLQDTGGSSVERIVINCDMVFVKITNQDDSTVTLYGLKKVEFIKENDTPAVRVTYADNSTMTYENPKKVEFGK